jgi:mxaL protein
VRACVRALRAEPLLAAACVLLALACALPPLPLPRRTGSYLLAFDITQSMDVADMRLAGAPVSRLAFARAAAAAALPQLPCGARVGWAIFTGYRSVPILAPLEVCAHYGALLASLEQIDGRMRWTNASHIAQGLFWAERSARALGPEVLPVLFTDGHEAPPRADLAGPELPAGARALLLGVGGEQPQPIPRSDAHGRSLGVWQAADVVQRPGVRDSHEQLSRLDEAHLRALGGSAHVAYARLSEASALPQLLAANARGSTLPAPTDVSWVPALLALLLLVLRSLRL